MGNHDSKFKILEEGIETLKKRVESLRLSTTSLVQSVQSFVIDFMTFKGLFTDKERDFLVKEVDRICGIYMMKSNPLRPEEAKFIQEVMKEIREKDPKEIDLSKLDKIIEIAKRWFLEDNNPDALRMMYYVYALKRILEKERGEF